MCWVLIRISEKDHKLGTDMIKPIKKSYNRSVLGVRQQCPLFWGDLAPPDPERLHKMSHHNMYSKIVKKLYLYCMYDWKSITCSGSEINDFIIIINKSVVSVSRCIYSVLDLFNEVHFLIKVKSKSLLTDATQIWHS